MPSGRSDQRWICMAMLKKCPNQINRRKTQIDLVGNIVRAILQSAEVYIIFVEANCSSFIYLHIFVITSWCTFPFLECWVVDKATHSDREDDIDECLFTSTKRGYRLGLYINHLMTKCFTSYENYFSQIYACHNGLK